MDYNYSRRVRIGLCRGRLASPQRRSSSLPCSPLIPLLQALTALESLLQALDHDRPGSTCTNLKELQVYYPRGFSGHLEVQSQLQGKWFRLEESDLTGGLVSTSNEMVASRDSKAEEASLENRRLEWRIGPTLMPYTRVRRTEIFSPRRVGQAWLGSLWSGVSSTHCLRYSEGPWTYVVASFTWCFDESHSSQSAEAKSVMSSMKTKYSLLNEASHPLCRCGRESRLMRSLEIYYDEHRSFSKGIHGMEQRMIALWAMNRWGAIAPGVPSWMSQARRTSWQTRSRAFGISKNTAAKGLLKWAAFQTNGSLRPQHVSQNIFACSQTGEGRGRELTKSWLKDSKKRLYKWPELNMRTFKQDTIDQSTLPVKKRGVPISRSLDIFAT